MRTPSLIPVSILVLLAACGGPPSEPGLALLPENPVTTDDLTLTITDGPDIEADDEVSYGIIWYRNDEEASQWLDATVVPSSSTTKGETWRAVVTAMDAKDRTSETVEVSTTVLNSLPVATVAIPDQAPVTTDDLVATLSVEDADEDDVTSTWTWLRDGTDAGVDGDTVPASMTARGEVWTARVVPNDGEADGEAAEAQVTIGNTAPVADSVSLSPDPAYTTSSLVAAPVGSDADAADTVSWSYTWFVNGSDSGITGDTLTGDAFSKGDVVRVEAVPDDGDLSGNTVAAEIAIQNSAPSLESAAIDQTEAYEGDTLTCTPSGWADADGDEATTRFQWEVNGTVVSTDASLSSAWFDRDDSVVCIATPWDGEDAGEPVRSDELVIGNTAPVIASVTLSDSSPQTNDTLVATVSGSDADGDAISYDVVWTVDGSSVTTETISGTTSSLSGSYFSKDQEVIATFTPADDSATGSSVSSSTATVINTPPTAPSVDISPSSPQADDNLLCEIGTASTDADGDSISYEFDWYVDGSLYTGALTTTTYADDTVASANTSSGEEWECVVTAWDGEEYGPDATSAVTVATPISPPAVGTGGSYGVISGNNWTVCRADSSSAWVAANTSGTYNAHAICQQWGYAGATSQGGTCGTVCGYCGTSGREYYDGGGGSLSSIRYTVHWKCE